MARRQLALADATPLRTRTLDVSSLISASDWEVTRAQLIREGNLVTLVFQGKVLAASAVFLWLLTLPSGWRPRQAYAHLGQAANATATPGLVTTWRTLNRVSVEPVTQGSEVRIQVSWTTGDAWPA